MYGYWSSVTWPDTNCTASYRHVLSSGRAHYKKNNKVIVKRRENIKSGHGPQRVPRYQDDWPTDRRPQDEPANQQESELLVVNSPEELNVCGGHRTTKLYTIVSQELLWLWDGG
jgi:hypothetical protein